MDYYNQQLFPGDEEDPLESLMDEERELLEAIDASEGEEGAAKDGENAAARTAKMQLPRTVKMQLPRTAKM